MRIINEVKLDFNDVLICPKRSAIDSRSQVNLIRTFETLNSNRTITGIPIIAANLDTVATFNMAKALSEFKIFTALHKFYKPTELIKFISNYYEYTFYTMGVSDEDIHKLCSSNNGNINKICIDIANGYTEFFVKKVREIRNMFPEAIIMAGNVATPEMVQELLIVGGVDIVKIGIGPGQVCKTREMTGVGYYQLSAIMECADVAHGLGGHICADGGCINPGDICKSFGAGADFTMLGTMLSGHDECDGEWEYENEIVSNNLNIPVLTGKKTKKRIKLYGMSSREAMEKYYGGVADYRASEGKCIWVPYKGPVKNTVQEILGGLRSCCSYVGATELKDLSKCTTFIRNK